MFSRFRANASSLSLALVLGLPKFLSAEPPFQQQVQISSTVNVVGQSVSGQVAQGELSASGDLFVDIPLGPFSLHAYMEASSTPRTDGVFARVPVGNADAGTALGPKDRGRVQLSEFRLRLDAGRGSAVHFGFMDLTGFLDVSRIANDENLFFLGSPFVNNPTIAFPDYVLGVTADVRSPWSAKARIAFSLSSSHGLADNPNRSYRELFDLGSPEKGAFVAGRIRWTGEHWRGAVGGWSDSSNRKEGDHGEEGGSRRGIFTVLGWASSIHAVNLRLGATTGSATGPTSFAGLTYLWQWRQNALGLGLARGGTSDAGQRDATGHAEAFLRRRLFSVLFVTGSLQWLSNSTVAEGQGGGDQGVLITGARLSASF